MSEKASMRNRLPMWVKSTAVAIGAASLLLAAQAPAAAKIMANGPHSTKSACVTVQSEFLRYYDVTRTCYHSSDSDIPLAIGWYFNYRQ
ncbi:MAG: hypothetical protein M0026_21810 [Nocardiopsaceae bacterium]|nr:hypothetical protein [Nocardiopsaceae bacterium]